MMETFLPTEYCRVQPDTTPRLLVVVDTEEEFDWSRDFARANDSVRAIRCIDRFQRICDDYRITPVYVVDFPVASQSDGYRPLQDIYKSRRCFIGAHLHPWVNPPFEEEVNRYNSFPGNLPPSLEARKLHILGDLIGERFGGRPVIYKAGRYGVGANTAEILEDQGYEVDVSFCPYMNYSAEGGPDFSHVPVQPFWFGKQRRLLEIPLSVGFVGGLRTWGNYWQSFACRVPLRQLHFGAVLSRSGLLNRVWLSPEGYSLAENVGLLRALYRNGLRVFSFALHSPSLEPGNTPFVTSRGELETFLSQCRRFFDYFLGELKGAPTNPLELKTYLCKAADDRQEEKI